MIVIGKRRTLLTRGTRRCLAVHLDEQRDTQSQAQSWLLQVVKSPVLYRMFLLSIVLLGSVFQVLLPSRGGRTRRERDN